MCFLVLSGAVRQWRTNLASQVTFPVVTFRHPLTPDQTPYIATSTLENSKSERERDKNERES